MEKINPFLSIRAPHFSELTYIGNIPNTDRVVMEDGRGGRYYEISEAPQTQVFTALLLKNTIRLCDTILVETPKGLKYFSYSPPGTDYESGVNIREYAEAEILFLALVFGDFDHVYKGTFGVGANSSNINNNHLLWDFGNIKKAFSLFRLDNTNPLLFGNKKISGLDVRRNFNHILNLYGLGHKLVNVKEIIRSVISICDIFVKEIDGEEGLRFIDSILHKLGTKNLSELFDKTDTCDFRLLQAELILRANNLKHMSEEKLLEIK